MIMQAVVIEVQWGRLLVLDLDARQRVLVNTPDASRFRPGDTIRIWYDGVMTASIPPQINAWGSPRCRPMNSRPPCLRPEQVRRSCARPMAAYRRCAHR